MPSQAPRETAASPLSPGGAPESGLPGAAWSAWPQA